MRLSNTPVSGGEAVIDLSGSSLLGTAVSINASNFSVPYTSVLGDNPGVVSWSFNVSNEDGQFNNSFGFALASSAPDPRIFTTSSYVFQGGGFVGNRMGLLRQVEPILGGPTFDFLIDIPNGLGTLPEMGSFQITYDPNGDLWSLFGATGPTKQDPRQVNVLLGTAVDDTLTNVDLPWTGIYGKKNQSISEA